MKLNVNNMANWCLVKEKAGKFIEKLKSGEISPEKMDAMSSVERRDYFKSFLGEADAKKVNLLYERKILNKNREQGLVRWAEQVSGKNTKQKEDLMQKIKNNTEERNRRLFSPKDEENFLNELVEARLGIGVTEEESKTLFKLAKDFKETKELFNKRTIHNKLESIKGKITGRERSVIDNLIDRLDGIKEGKKAKSLSLSRIKRYLGEGAPEDVQKDIDKLVNNIVSARKTNEYGYAKVALDEYVGDIKLGIKQKQTIKKTVEDIAGFSKSTVASIDNSFIGRQGLKTLYSGHPIVWFKSMVNSFETLAKVGIKNQDALRGIKAEIFNRTNSKNGLYEKMKLDIGIIEEAYPTTLPEKIPMFGRAFKASNQAFTGSAYRMRADLADVMIDKARKQGVDLDDITELESIGMLVNSMTGRGKIQSFTESGQRIANVTLFSPKFLKAQLDTVGQIFSGGRGSNFVRKEAAKNLLGIVGSISSIMYLADKLQPGSVEWDSRSSDFGKIKIGNTRFDVTGGMASFVTLAARIATGATKSTTTGKITKQSAFGAKTASELAANFLENKTAPLLRTIFNIQKGHDFDKNPISFEALKEEPVNTSWVVAKGFIVPIPIDNAFEAYKSRATEPALAATILDMMGVGANIYNYSDNWAGKTSKEMEKFKEEKGFKTLREANKQFNTRVNVEIMELSKSEEFNKKSPEEKDKEIKKIKRDIKEDIFKQYNFQP